MSVPFCALALLGGAIGAGFASGREIQRFFAVHGAFSMPAACCAAAVLYALLRRLPAQMEARHVPSVPALCQSVFGVRFGRVCAALFLLLEAVAAGAMLAACAELCALTLPLRHAYALGLALSLLLALGLARAGLSGMALPGGVLCCILPVLLVRLLRLPAGEACFSPSLLRPAYALADGASYAALNMALLLGVMPMLLTLPDAGRRRAALLFSLLFFALLMLGIAVLRRHLPAVLHQALPFVVLARGLGKRGYFLLAASLYAAALSTLSAMLSGMRGMLPGRGILPLLSGGALALLFALLGFEGLVSVGYPVLGAVCAALMLLLCLPEWRKE